MFNDIHINEQTENSSNDRETTTNLTNICLTELEMEITVWALESHEAISQINAEYDQRKFNWCCVKAK